MNDDSFDRDLARRLAAHESGLPDAHPPGADVPLQRGMPRWPLIGVGVLAAVAAVLAAAVLLGGFRDDRGEASPSPSAAATATGQPTTAASEQQRSESPSPTTAVTPSPPSLTGVLDWSETGALPAAGDPSAVNDVLQHDSGLVAVGVAYEGQLPILGPAPAHEGRVWLSTDGTDWEDATPRGTFDNVVLQSILRTSDGALITLGWATPPDSDAIGSFVAWQSPDGRTWEPIASPFGNEAWATQFAQGGRGSVAIVVDPGGPSVGVWWSADARAWERVHDLGAEASWSLAAGDEGFVIAGRRSGQDGTDEPFAIASGDGREWFEADGPPGAAVSVAPREGDWLAVSQDLTVVLGQPTDAQVWSSANGLSWTPIGGYALETIQRAEDTTCTELPTSLLVAGPWLVSGTMLSFGCSEGGVVTQGAQRISLDGVTWTVLPFGAAATEIGLGTRIAGAIEVDGRLVLVGEQDRVATFWVGEQP